RAYVRLDALIAAHPLQGQIRQLEAAEANLRRLGSQTMGAAPVAPYDLPALSSTPSSSALSELTQARRRQQRDLLQRIAAQQIQTYLDAWTDRQRRLIDQHRAELVAALTAKDA